MSDEARIVSDRPPAIPARNARWVWGFTAVALTLLAGEAFYFYSAKPRLDAAQKALLAWQGVRAADFCVTNLDGQPIRLGDLHGKRVILNFWATWCPPCVEETPRFVKLRNQTSPADVAILGLSTADVATQRAFARRAGINYPLALLQDVPSPYQDVDAIPVTMVIDRNGIIQHVLFGPQDFKTLQAAAEGTDFAGPVKAAPR